MHSGLVASGRTPLGLGLKLEPSLRKLRSSQAGAIGRSNHTSGPSYPNHNVHLLGRRLTLMTVPAIVEAISAAIAQERRITIGHYNVHGFNLSMQLPWFHNFLQAADIAHCDGMGIIKALSFLGIDLPRQYRVSYSLLMPALLQECDRKGLKMFLLGSKPQALASALGNLRQQYPNASFAGQHGYFPRSCEQANASVVEAINAAQPDILLVGMGMPIQEEWVLQHRKQLNVKAVLVGGAIIDRLAGQVSHCPAMLSNLGLEWIYRLLREPRRLGPRYLLGNPAFVCQILLAKLLGLHDSLEPENATLMAAAQAIANTSTARSPQKRLGEYLVEAGLLTPQHIRQALLEQRQSGLRLGEILVSQGYVCEATVKFVIAHGALETRSLDRAPGHLSSDPLNSPPRLDSAIAAHQPSTLLSQPSTSAVSPEPRSHCPNPYLSQAAPTADPKRLGEYLIEAGLSTPQAIRNALDIQRHSPQRLGEILVAQGTVRAETVEFMVAHFHGMAVAESVMSLG